MADNADSAAGAAAAGGAGGEAGAAGGYQARRPKGPNAVKEIAYDLSWAEKRRIREQGLAETVTYLEPKGKADISSEVGAVAALAGKLGIGGEDFETMALTWLRPIVDEGIGSTRRGIERGRRAVKFIGQLLSGARFGKALEASGLTKAELNAFRFVCPAFGDMVRLAREAMKEMMGQDVLDTAYDLATEGEAVYDRDGNEVGRKRSEKMLDRLLVMSGPEFRREKGVPGAGAGGGGDRPAVALTFNFGGGNTQMGVVDVQAEG